MDHMKGGVTPTSQTLGAIGGKQGGRKMENEKKFSVISDRWAGSSDVSATFDEIQRQAAYFERDRRGNLDAEESPEISVRMTVRHGKNVVVDEAGEIIAVEL